MHEIFTSLRNSLAQLRIVLAEPKSVIVRDASIKRFELCVELAWKVTQAYLWEQGIECNSPVKCFQEAYAVGLVDDDMAWRDMFKARNLSVHTYDETFADDLYTRIPTYLTYLSALEERIAERIANTTQ